jgi:hypothetical protein
LGESGEIDPDDVPGLPSKRSNSVILAVASGVAALPMLALAAYGVRECSRTTMADTIAEIAVTGLDQPAEHPLQLAAGTEVLFAVATGYEYSDNPVVMLTPSLLRDGVEVAKNDCNMKGFTGVGAFGSGRNTFYGDAGWTCSLTVPEGGASALRVKVWRSGKGALELSGTTVIVKKP